MIKEEPEELQEVQSRVKAEGSSARRKAWFFRGGIRPSNCCKKFFLFSRKSDEEGSPIQQRSFFSRCYKHLFPRWKIRRSKHRFVTPSTAYRYAVVLIVRRTIQCSLNRIHILDNSRLGSNQAFLFTRKPFIWPILRYKFFEHVFQR